MENKKLNTVKKSLSKIFKPNKKDGKFNKLIIIIPILLCLIIVVTVLCVRHFTKKEQTVPTTVTETKQPVFPDVTSDSIKAFDESNVADSEKSETSDTNYSVTDFNKDGQKIRDITYDYETPSFGNLYEYDENGNFKRIIHYSYGENGDITEITVTDFNADKIVAEYKTDNGEFDHYYTYEYSDAGVQTKEVHYKSDETIEYSLVTEYNDSLQKTKYSNILADGTVSAYTIYDYDDFDRLIRESHFDKEDVLVNYAVYKYDSDGNMTCKNYNADGTEMK